MPCADKGNAAFWEHEWDCHGVCAGVEDTDLSTEEGFFNSVLQLDQQYPLTVSACLCALRHAHPEALGVAKHPEALGIARQLSVKPACHAIVAVVSVPAHADAHIDPQICWTG